MGHDPMSEEPVLVLVYDIHPALLCYVAVVLSLLLLLLPSSSVAAVVVVVV